MCDSESTYGGAQMVPEIDGETKGLTTGQIA